ncbi:MAG: efflux RND transporter periplasmic adaptor subunit [Deltaproteobacteria bacterium]|nr:efflux RND transporter periplasmic adaptor subunit [Deltaproteobacteria bacterium]MBI3077575.1 efflux RND transporter periplasmic adaptor subunit [Deltaproteobacteria bacterium]
MSYKTVVAWGIVLLAAGGAYLVQRTYGKPAMNMDVTAPGGTAAKVSVTVAQAEVRSLAETATYTGTVAAYAEEDVYPRVTGRIVAMPVYPGTRVEPGQVVARLDEVELGSKVREAAAAAGAAEANLAQMEADVLAARHGITQMERELAMASSDAQAAQHGIAQMEKELAMVEAEAGYQETLLAREERLFRSGAVSRQDVENARAMAAAARAKVQAGQAKVEQAKAMATASQAKVDAARAKLEQAKAMEGSALKKQEAMAAMVVQSRAMQRTAEVVRDYVNIRAANDGYVVKRLVAPGTLVQPGMAILKIAQIDRVRFQANVAERDVTRLRVGSAVRVRVAGEQKPPLALRVTSMFPFAEGPSRTAVVEAVTENPGRRFLPGQYMVMEFELGERASVVSVPRGAVQRLGEQAHVWTLGSETVARRQVKTGPADADRVAILAGLQAGETVIVSGHENLHEGARVAVVGGAALADAGKPGVPEPAAPRGSPPADSPGRDRGGHALAAPEAGAKLHIQLATPPKSLRPSTNQIRIQVRDGAGAPVTDATVDVTSIMTGMTAAKVRARPGENPGEYEANVNLGMAGTWELEVVAARRTGPPKSAKFTVEAK